MPDPAHLRLRRRLGALAAGAAILAAASARAAPLPDGGVTRDEVAKIMQDKGYRAQPGVDAEGDPKIDSATEGYKFLVYFYGCKGTPARCTSLQFHAGWHVEHGFKLEDANLWNRTKRFGRAYVDSDHDPNVEMDVDLEHGATSEAVANDLDTWDLVVANFARWLDCASKPADDACRKDYS